MGAQFIWMPCKIENSGFSSERRFEVQMPSGPVVGVAYIEHFRDEDRNELPEGPPPYGQSIEGYVRCRVIRKQGGQAIIEFPGTDVLQVPQDALASSW